MKTRLVLRIERQGQLLGSWSLGDAPLQMKLVDLVDNRVVACFTASAEALELATAGGVDEIPLPLPRLRGDDFTMPMPEPTVSEPLRADTEEAPLAETEEAPRRRPRAVPNLARVPRSAGEGLTSELVPMSEEEALQAWLDEPGGGLTSELQPFDDDEPEGAHLVGPGRAVPSVADSGGILADEGQGTAPLDEIPLGLERGGLERATQPGLTGELQTATSALGPLDDIGLGGDERSLPHHTPSQGPSSGRSGAGGTDPKPTPQARIRPATHRGPPPIPAEVWAQKRGQWRSVGRLVPGQRVSTLGGWVRLAPDGRLVVSSGQSLAGSATLLDGRLLPIQAGQPYLALPPGTSVMLAVGDRGIYVRSEPLPEAPASPRAPGSR